MPDGQGYVVLDEYGLVYKFGSATSPQTVGSLSMGFYPGQDVAALDRDDARRQGLPDPARRREHPEVRFGRYRRHRRALGHPPWPGADDGRSIAVMPDGAGYVVLDKLGGVNKYGTRDHWARSAPDPRRTGASTSGATS